MFKDNSQLALKRVETSVVPIVGKGVICHVLAILLPLLTVHSTSIMCQNNIIFILDE
jgi:hypothetical protein